MSDDEPERPHSNQDAAAGDDEDPVTPSDEESVTPNDEELAQSSSDGAAKSGHDAGAARSGPSSGMDSAGHGDGTAKPGYDEQFCSSCGELVKKQAEICPECGVRIGGASGGSPRGRQQSSGNTQKDAGVALLLSAITSGWAGQIYNGQAGKGIAILVVQFINVILMFFVVGFLTFPLVWLYGCYDAYNVANKINRGEIQV